MLKIFTVFILFMVSFACESKKTQNEMNSFDACSDTLHRDLKNNICWLNTSATLRAGVIVDCGKTEGLIKICPAIKIEQFNVCNEAIFIDEKNQFCFVNTSNTKRVGFSVPCELVKNSCGINIKGL